MPRQVTTRSRAFVTFMTVGALSGSFALLPVCAAVAQDAPPASEPATPPADQPAADKPATPPAPANEAPPVNLSQLRAAAQMAMKNGQWAEAVNAWSTLLQFIPGDEEAIRGRARAQTMLEGGGTITVVENDRELLRQRAIAQFEADVKRANELLARQDFQNANLAAVTTRTRIDQARSVLSAAEYERMTSQAEELVNKISDASREAQLQTARTTREQMRTQADSSARTEAENRSRRVNEILMNVRKLQMQQKYPEAKQVLEGALAIDPHNPAAAALRDALETTITYQRYMETQKNLDKGVSQLGQEALRAIVPPSTNLTGPGMRSTSGVMVYPEDWAELTGTRANEPEYGASGYRESPGNLATLARLHTQTLPVPFDNDGTLEAAIAYFKDTAKIDFWIDWTAIKNSAQLEQNQTAIKLELGPTPVDVALKRVLESVRNKNGDAEPAEPLAFDVQDGIVVITTKSGVQKRQLTVVYDVRDLLFRAPNFDNAPQFNLNQAISQTGTTAGGGGGSGGGGGGFGGGGGGGFGGGGGGSGGGGGGGNIFGQPGEAPDRGDPDEILGQLKELIYDQIVDANWAERGMGTGKDKITEFNRNLIITASADAQRQIEGLLQQLRAIRALQVNIEGRLIAVSLEWFEQLGIDFDLYFNSNDRMWSAAKAVNPDFQLKDFFYQKDSLFNNNGARTGRLKNPVIWDTFTGNSAIANSQAGQTGFPVNDGTTPAGTGTTIAYAATAPVQPVGQREGEISPINVQQEGLPLVNTLAAAGLSTFGAAALAAPALVTGFTYLDDVQVDLLITATQADQRNVVLTAPRLTLYNCQRSWISVAKVIAYISNLIPVTGDNSGAFNPVISNVYEGFVLDVEACISGDRRYVTMTVLFGLNQNVKFTSQTITGAAGGGGGTGGGGRAATFEGEIQLPELSGTQINTTVTVPDKGTILLGGQRLLNELEVEVGVPLLSKIPFVNRFFTNRITAKTEVTLLLLIRPEIIIQQEHEDTLYPGLRNSLGSSTGF